MKTIVVGGSSGIGAAIAGKCLESGHEVITLQRRRGQYAWEQLDLRWSRNRIRGAVQHAAGPQLDFLVIAGGAASYIPPQGIEEAKVDEMIQTNYLGPRWVFEAALKPLARSEWARVLYVSSTTVKNRVKRLEDYAASKAAGETFFTHAARNVARLGVKVNVLRTGWISTPMTDAIEPELQERIRQRSPLGRMGEPEEVAEVAYRILTGPDFWVGDVIEFSGGAG